MAIQYAQAREAEKHYRQLRTIISISKMCETKSCKKKPSKTRKYCYSCLQQKYKERDPVRYAYYVLKNNAKRRGKEFTITLTYFRSFSTRTNYMAGKGREKESYHIDRVDEEKGYVVGNLKVLTNSENVKKYMEYQYGPDGRPTDFKIKQKQNLNVEDYPF